MAVVDCNLDDVIDVCQDRVLLPRESGKDETDSRGHCSPAIDGARNRR